MSERANFPNRIAAAIAKSMATVAGHIDSPISNSRCLAAKMTIQTTPAATRFSATKKTVPARKAFTTAKYIRGEENKPW